MLNSPRTEGILPTRTLESRTLLPVNVFVELRIYLRGITQRDCKHIKYILDEDIAVVMPSGLLPAHYGAPRHFSLPSITNQNPPSKPYLMVGHCDSMNLFYVRECPENNNMANYSHRVALMKYRKIKPGLVRVDGMHVPENMRGRGVSCALAREALQHLTQQNMWIDVRCPVTRKYIHDNQYAQYVRQMVKPSTNANIDDRRKSSIF